MSALWQLVTDQHARLLRPVSRLAQVERASVLQLRRRIRPYAILGVAALIAVDASLPPWAQPSCYAARAAIHGYRAAISPLLRGSVRCRYIPSCSLYGEQSIRAHGTWVGTALTLERLTRCRESVVPGTSDPAPTGIDTSSDQSGNARRVLAGPLVGHPDWNRSQVQPSNLNGCEMSVNWPNKPVHRWRLSAASPDQTV